MLKKILIWTGSIILAIYLLIITLIFFTQENLLFYPEKLASDYSFTYNIPFEELKINVDKEININGLLFKADSTKGLIFYLHGNGGSLATWGRAAKPFLANNYDCFIFDYRGYGKSSGEITSEGQLHEDIQKVYNEVTKNYDEKNVIIVGYSLGTGLASKLASQNHPQKLILQAPYNNIGYLLNLHYPLLPEFALRYPITTDVFLEKVEAPVTVLHGDEDKLIPIECSFKLKEGFKKIDKLIILKGANHHRMSENKDYQLAIKAILSE